MIVARLMTTFEVPVLVNVTLCAAVWPTAVLPKSQVAGEMDRPACAPVPVSETFKGESVASLMMVIAPLVAPAAVGAN